MRFESKGMLRDRAYAIAQTIFHDPCHQRHVAGAPQGVRFAVRRAVCDSEMIPNSIIHPI